MTEEETELGPAASASDVRALNDLLQRAGWDPTPELSGALTAGNFTDWTGTSDKAVAMIDELNSSDRAASSYWKGALLRRQLRDTVRRIVDPLGQESWKAIPAQADEYAVKHKTKS